MDPLQISITMWYECIYWVKACLTLHYGLYIVHL